MKSSLRARVARTRTVDVPIDERKFARAETRRRKHEQLGARSSFAALDNALGASDSRTDRVRTRYAEVLRRCGHAAEAEALEAKRK